jgi:hypothetical protein
MTKRAGGLEVNVSKTKFLWLHESRHLILDCIESQLDNMGIEIELGATVLLGAPIGTDESKMKDLLMKNLEEQQLFFRRIDSSLLSIQEAHLTASVCATST